MYNEIIKLVSETETTNEYGDIVKKPVEKTVFAEVMSVGMSEFYQAAAVGLKPEIKFKLADYLDYGGEKKLKYSPYQGTEEEYIVIKTYRKGIELELTCKRGVDE